MELEGAGKEGGEDWQWVKACEVSQPRNSDVNGHNNLHDR